jgi:predicted  nucleic acid-binding Zn-ribbon protein
MVALKIALRFLCRGIFLWGILLRTVLLLVIPVFSGNVSVVAQEDSLSSVVRISSIEEVISKWKENRHLYIKGNIGVSEEQLGKLQSWLSENGTHWTVVLMESAEGETYHAPDGRSYAGMDAVEYALGHGLSNRTSFGEWTHPESKETDGAIFALFLKERKFSYFASDAQDRRRLGEANWVGQLDQPAFRAMRNGGRIIDAVKDTVQHINGRLNASIAVEAADVKRREETQQRTIAVLNAALEESKQAINKVEAIARQWKSDFATATGPLAKPPLEAWRQKVDKIRNLLTQADLNSATQHKSNLATEIDRYLNLYAASAEFETQRKQIEQNVEGYKTSVHAVAKQGAEETQAILEKATQERSQGSFDFVTTLQAATQKLAEIQTKVAEEEARIALEEQRAQMIRSAVWGTSAIFIAIITLILYILHRRRAPFMHQAIQEIQKREKSVQDETEEIDQLFERNRVLLGSEQRISERGYTGRTKEVALQALQYVDDLFIMSKEIRRVLADAKVLVEPNSWRVRLLNYFSARKYQEAIHLVTGAPLFFYAETGIPRILRDIIAEKKKSDVNPSSNEEIEATFEQVYRALDQRGNEAKQRLDLFENSLVGMDDLLNNLQREIEKVAATEQELHRQFASDGWFEVPALIKNLLPALQNELKQADEQSSFDAVGAVEGPVVLLSRKLTESRKLCEIVGQFRASKLPLIAEAERQIDAQGYRRAWIATELQKWSEHANELVDQLLTESVANLLNDLQENLDRLATKAAAVGGLAERMEKELLPSLVSTKKALEEARTKLATQLKIGAEHIFEETENDPDVHYQQAEKDLSAAKALLNEGQLEACQKSIEVGLKERGIADSLILSSLTAVEDFATKAGEIENRRELCLKVAGELNEKLSTLADQFQESAFVLDTNTAADGVDYSASLILRHVVNACEQLVPITRDAQRTLEVGKVLRAANIQMECISEVDHLEHQCIAVEEHLQKVETLAASNFAHWARQQREVASWDVHRNDPLICDGTLIAMSKLQDDVAKFEGEVILGAGVIPNPFDTQERLEQVESEIERMKGACVADRQAYAEAKRAVDGAERQSDAAQRASAQSQTDNIPDSPLTSELNRKIQMLSREVETLKQELREPHGNWHILDDKAAKLQSKIVTSTQQLSAELDSARHALEAFESASRMVFQAEQWSGPWGLRVSGSPGSHDLERARYGLQSGNYSVVLEISRLAMLAAQAAVEQMEREARRRQMEADRAAEERRRERDRASRSSFSSSSSRSSSSRSFASSSSSSRSSSSSSSSSSNSSGFSRSSW